MQLVSKQEGRGDPREGGEGWALTCGMENEAPSVRMWFSSEQRVSELDLLGLREFPEFGPKSRLKSREKPGNPSRPASNVGLIPSVNEQVSKSHWLLISVLQHRPTSLIKWPLYDGSVYS